MARKPEKPEKPEKPRKPQRRRMSRRSLDELAKGRDFVAGIYNYCDRWCERCPYTQRCMNYAIGEEFFPDAEQHDLKSQQYWDGLKEIFAQTRAMLVEMGKEQGIDLEHLPPETEEEARRDQEEEDAVRRHPLTTAGMSYIKQVDAWFKRNKGMFKAKRRELTTLARLELAEQHPEQDAQAIIDAVEVIRWYQHQITVKLMRALSRDEEIEEELEGEGFQKDSDGSAKVSLLGMDRSLAAWGVLREQFPDEGDAILDLLVHLDRLRRAAEKEFPQARAFVRPGFDTGGRDLERERREESGE